MSSTGDRPWCAPIDRICSADRVGDRAVVFGPERAGHADRLGERGGLAGHQPGADLLVDERRDAEPGVLAQVALDRVRQLGRGDCRRELLPR